MLPYHRAAVALRRAESVAVCAHVRPDGDAIGSTLGLTLALRAAGISAIPVLADGRPAPATYAFLPGFALLTQVSDLDMPHTFVALDTPVRDRLGEAATLLDHAETSILLDHHPDATSYADHCILDSMTASTGQLVWRLVRALDVVPTPEIALCLYVALMTDTGRFSHGNTTAEALRDAAEMLDAGVDAAEASRLVYQERSVGALELEARALDRIAVTNGGRVAWTWVTETDFEETGAAPEEAELLADAVRQLGGVEVVMLLRRSDDGIRGNLRAKTGADVASVARSLGGGGHRAAAGFTVEGADVERVAHHVLALLPGGRSS